VINVSHETFAKTSLHPAAIINQKQSKNKETTQSAMASK
jgi:hypothetical protein